MSEPAGPGTALEEFSDRPPAGWPWDGKWLIRFVDDAGALESWARQGGASWMRLNVVVGNARAERFWEMAGYSEVRRRGGVGIGRRVNEVRVMLKPLAGEGLPAYLSRVPRDRPGSP